jgi:hypothetical protein
MPPLILWALGAIGAAVAGRWVYREAQRVNTVLHPEEEPQPVDERGAMPKLERDPNTGVYRPK